jgi:hypothetical protein
MNSFSDAPQSTCDTKILLTYNVILTRSKWNITYLYCELISP